MIIMSVFFIGSVHQQLESHFRRKYDIASIGYHFDLVVYTSCRYSFEISWSCDLRGLERTHEFISSGSPGKAWSKILCISTGTFPHYTDRHPFQVLKDFEIRSQRLYIAKNLYLRNVNSAWPYVTVCPTLLILAVGRVRHIHDTIFGFSHHPSVFD